MSTQPQDHTPNANAPGAGRKVQSAPKKTRSLPKQKPNNKYINWDVIEEDFVAGELTAFALAEKHKVSYGMVCMKRKELNWDLKQTEWRSRRKVQGLDNIMNAQIQEVVNRFRSSEDIRASAADTFRTMSQVVRDAYIDPKTGKRRTRLLTTRQQRELAETLDRTFKGEMQSSGHEVLANVIKLEGRVLVAGVTTDQLAALDDAALDRALAVADQAKQIPTKVVDITPPPELIPDET